MRLSRILIGGYDYINQAWFRGTEIVKEASDRMGTAKLAIQYLPTDANIPASGQPVEIYAIDGDDDTGGNLWDRVLWGALLFDDPTSEELVFAGIVTLVEPKMLRAGIAALYPDADNIFDRALFDAGLFDDPITPRARVGTVAAQPAICLATIECRDWNALIDTTYVETAGSYTNKTDQYIIQDLFGTYLPSIDTTNVANTATLATFERKEESLRSLLQRIQEQTGAIAFVDPNKVLYYRLPSAVAAPFALSESSSHRWERESLRFSQEWRAPANKVIVLGEVSSGGDRIRATVEDLTSQAEYGIFTDTIVDSQIKSVDEATARGNVELAKRGNPIYGGSCTVRERGLDVGQYLDMDASVTMNFSGSFVITRMTLRWDSKTQTKYDIEWGAYRPDEARAMAAIYRLAKPGGAVLPTTPAPLTVGGGSIIPGSIDGATHIANASISQAQMGNASIGTAQIQNASISDAKIINISAAKITTGDLIVGYTGYVGMIDVRDSGNNTFMWAGKNGSDYGLWTKVLWIGGTGPSNAKIKAEATGSITASLSDTDDFELISSTNTRKAKISPSGIEVIDTSTVANLSQMRQQAVSVLRSDSSFAILQTLSGIGRVIVSGGGSNDIKLESDGANTGLYFGSTRVVKSRITGWTAATGASSRGGFDTSTVILANLAANVRCLIDDLMAHGLIG